MKKEKTKLRVIQILCIVSLLITVFSIQRTYAKYFEKVDTTYATNIKRWIINVNGANIHNEETLSDVMTPKFFYNPDMNVNGDINDTDNEYLNNILVPGREGCFDFLIDYTSVDVAFKFSFDIEQLNKKTEVDETTGDTTQTDAHLDDFEVYGYAIVDTDFEITPTTTIADVGTITTLTKDGNGKYQLSGLTQEIDPSTETEKQKRILVLFRWNDGDGSTMDNTADTAFEGEENAEDSLHDLLKYNVKITFKQKI